MQRSVCDVDQADVTSPDLSGNRLVVWRTPLVASERLRTCQQRRSATEAALDLLGLSLRP